MVETRAQAMANEKIDKLEQTLQTIQSQLDRLFLQIPKGKEEAHEEAYNGNGHNEGESSHLSSHLAHPPTTQSVTSQVGYAEI